jgi:DNA-directed RNA polymerase subunit RPC12/RpoP
MKKLQTFSHRERPLANLFRERLAGEGIVCLVRNDELSSALGEIPFVECYPELWVVDAEVWPRARLLLEQWQEEAVELKPEWACQNCGERLEGQFQSCWRCGREFSD